MKRLPAHGPPTALVRGADVADGSFERGEDFASIVAHELRSPLAIVEMAAATVLEHQEELEPQEMVEVMRIIHRNTNLAILLLRRLELARDLGVGNVRLERRLVDLAEIAREATSDLTDVLLKWYATEVHAPAAVVVHADPTAVRAIVFNLLSNAAKYSPRGTHIDVLVAQRQDDAQITVRDRGCGVRSGDADRVFEKYHQEDPSRPGVGLGLYVSRGLARAHGGDLEVRARADEGSEFRLTLPKGTPG